MEKELTPEKEKQIRRLAIKYLFKSFLTGIHHAIMLMVINIIVFMVSATFFDHSVVVDFTGMFFAFLFVYRRINTIMIARRDILIQESFKILDQ